MSDDWEKKSSENSRKPMRGGRGRGINPALKRSPEREVGRPSRRDEPRRNGCEITYWHDEGSRDLSYKQDHKDLDLGGNQRRNREREESRDDRFYSRGRESEYRRSEDRDSGYRRSEDRDAGYRRSEDRDSGYRRSEDRDAGYRRSDDRDSGYRRSEDRDAGYRRSDDRDAGYRRSDDRDAGYRRSDDRDAGYRRSEDRDADYRRSDDRDAEYRHFDDRASDSRRSRESGSHYRRMEDRMPEYRHSERRGFRDDDLDESRPRPSLYIPRTPTEDEDEIFGTGISSGINFDKYDDIKVHVSGGDPVPPIHSFDEAGVKPIIRDLIVKCNYTKPTPIQKYAIPIVMSGRDLMACAQTGSGKTAAYLIPIMDKILETPRSPADYDYICKPQALVVAPTRELTIQIFNEARKFSRGSFLRIELAYGGTAVNHQIQLLTRKGCDFLVATPGRLLDIIRRGKINFGRLKFFVLDEADRMLDLGFLPDMEEVMEHVLGQCQIERQTLMFSATFPEEIQILAGKFLKDYLFVAVGIVGGACSDVEQKLYAVSKYEKRHKLLDLLTQLGNSKCLIFVEQKRTTDVIAAFLCEKNFRATSIHGGREQREREEALNDFKNGRMRILVATSVAARGLDIKNVGHVINYDLPKSIDDYVHRIGRTGRVGNRGSAISFYDEHDDSGLAADLVKVLKQTGHRIPEFLQNFGGDPHGYDSESRFGGRDVRNLHADDAYTVEEEIW